MKTVQHALAAVILFASSHALAERLYMAQRCVATSESGAGSICETKPGVRHFVAIAPSVSVQPGPATSVSDVDGVRLVSTTANAISLSAGGRNYVVTWAAVLHPKARDAIKSWDNVGTSTTREASRDLLRACADDKTLLSGSRQACTVTLGHVWQYEFAAKDQALKAYREALVYGTTNLTAYDVATKNVADLTGQIAAFDRLSLHESNWQQIGVAAKGVAAPGESLRASKIWRAAVALEDHEQQAGAAEAYARRALKAKAPSNVVSELVSMAVSLTPESTCRQAIAYTVLIEAYAQAKDKANCVATKALGAAKATACGQSYLIDEYKKDLCK